MSFLALLAIVAAVYGLPFSVVLNGTKCDGNMSACGFKTSSSASFSLPTSRSASTTTAVTTSYQRSDCRLVELSRSYPEHPEIDDSTLSVFPVSSPVSISSLLGLDAVYDLGDPSDVVVFHQFGSDAAASDYSLLSSPLPLSLAPNGGRGSDGVLPLVNLFNEKTGQGVVVSVGWSGGWNFSAVGCGSTSVCVTVRGADLNAVVFPGESVRGPRVAVRQYNGTSAFDGYNFMRQWMLESVIPRGLDGEVRGAIVSSWTWIGWKHPNTSNQMEHIEYIADAGMEAWWLDAQYFVGGFPNGVGNWQVPFENVIDRTSFPTGLQPLSDAAHARGLDSIVWIEPERGHEGTFLPSTYPSFYLKVSNSDDYLLDLGNDGARRYMASVLAEFVDHFELSVLRIDFNIAPEGYWAAGDAEQAGRLGVSRTGMTEAGYVTGLYTLWDELLALRPHLMIDDCASGGRRIDLETMSRATPLWRSDFGSASPQGLQSQTQGLSLFLPIHSGGVASIDPYDWRSAGVVGKTADWTQDTWQSIIASNQSLQTLQAAVNETKRLRNTVLDPTAKYYPLLPTANVDTSNGNIWIAYQYTTTTSGFVIVFRQANANQSTVSIPFQALQSTANYTVTSRLNYTIENQQTLSGNALLKGIPITLQPSTSLLLEYQIQS